MSSRLVQVTNVSTSVTKEQLKSLFTYLGRVEEIQLYPESEALSTTLGAKVAYIKYDRSEIAQAALNLTNTVFLDRPIICSLVKYSSSSSSSSSSKIPDEIDAIKMCSQQNPNVALIPGGITWPHNVINRIVTVPGVGNAPATTYYETIDPNLMEKALPAYPKLPGTIDQSKAEELRRTIIVSQLDPRTSFEHLYELFNQIGEIKFIRMTISKNLIEYENVGLYNLNIPQGIEPNNDSVNAFIEFTEQPSIVKAMCLNGLKLGERVIKVNIVNNP